MTNDLNTVIEPTDAGIDKVYIPDTKKQFKILEKLNRIGHLASKTKRLCMLFITLVLIAV